MRLIRSFCIAVSAYSRIPVPQVEWNEENSRYAMCFFPFIGLVIGAVLWGWLWMCDRFGLGVFLRGAVSAAIPLMITGGIHMDGFMDTTDALSSWKPMEERRAILKDSHVGAFAVMECVLYLLCMAGVMSEAAVTDIIPLTACFVLSRAASALALTWFRHYGHHGMLASIAEKQKKKAVTLACGLWCAVAAVALAVCAGWAGVATLGGCILCAVFYRHKAYKYFDGVSGDLAGWFLQTAELVCIACVILGRCVLS